MIYIDISRLHFPPNWRERAERATNKLLRLPEDQRSAFLESHSDIWRDLKPALEELSSRKCWYCEGRTARFDFHVDHHRPKNRVKNKDGTQEQGYWWLAFDYRNFRLACDYCDSLHVGPNGITRGKADRFPLAPGSIRASSPGSNIEAEVPLLLDPTRPSDPLFLWFLDSGQACPSCTTGLPHQRAKETIDVLNLNDIRVVEERKKLWNDIISLLERGNRTWEQYEKGSPAALREFEYVIRDIQDRVSLLAEFSATARACLKGSAYPWARAFFV